MIIDRQGRSDGRHFAHVVLCVLALVHTSFVIIGFHTKYGWTCTLHITSSITFSLLLDPSKASPKARNAHTLAWSGSIHPQPQSLQFLVALPLRPPAPGSTPLPLLPSSASHPPRRPPLDCRGGPSGFALFPSSFRSAPPSVRIELAWLARINPLTPSSCFPVRFMPMPLLSLMF